jgi:hypothetical protein
MLVTEMKMLVTEMKMPQTQLENIFWIEVYNRTILDYTFDRGFES